MTVVCVAYAAQWKMHVNVQAAYIGCMVARMIRQARSFENPRQKQLCLIVLARHVTGVLTRMLHDVGAGNFYLQAFRVTWQTEEGCVAGSSPTNVHTALLAQYC